VWAQVKSLTDYRTTFHAQNCPERAKGRFQIREIAFQVGNASEKRKVYCIKLILDTVLSVHLHYSTVPSCDSMKEQLGKQYSIFREQQLYKSFDVLGHAAQRRR